MDRNDNKQSGRRKDRHRNQVESKSKEKEPRDPLKTTFCYKTKTTKGAGDFAVPTNRYPYQPFYRHPLALLRDLPYLCLVIVAVAGCTPSDLYPVVQRGRSREGQKLRSSLSAFFWN